jgi:hypothetical protein
MVSRRSVDKDAAVTPSAIASRVLTHPIKPDIFLIVYGRAARLQISFLMALEPVNLFVLYPPIAANAISGGAKNE